MFLQLTDFTGFSFYGFVRLVPESVHTLLTSAASRSMEFTDVLKNFTHSVQRRICFCFVSLLHNVTECLLVLVLEETANSQSLFTVNSQSHDTQGYVDFYHTTVSHLFSALKNPSPFSCSLHRNHTTSLIILCQFSRAHFTCRAHFTLLYLKRRARIVLFKVQTHDRLIKNNKIVFIIFYAFPNNCQNSLCFLNTPKH